MRPRARRQSIAVATATLAVALVGGAWASSSADSERIYACASKNAGHLRVVERKDQCHSSETALTWNIRGPAGPADRPARWDQPDQPAAKAPPAPRAPTGHPARPGRRDQPVTADPPGPWTRRQGRRSQGPKGDSGPAGPPRDPRDPPERAADPPPAWSSRGVGPTNFGTLPASLTVATMADVAPGDYLVSAKTTVRSSSGLTFAATNCQLRAGAMVIDQTRVGGADLTSAAVSLQGTASFSSASALSVVCNLPANGAFASDTKLSALRCRPGVGRGGLGLSPAVDA